MLITGNKKYGLAEQLYKIYPAAKFLSRETGYDLTQKSTQELVAQEALEHDIFINNSALYKFEQVNLLNNVYKIAKEQNHNIFIINIGSTIDRYSKGTDWIYSAEKKALRDYSSSLGKQSVWNNGPKVNLISFGSLSNVQHKHPDRVCMDISVAAQYVKWLVDQPSQFLINEISIDPIQKK
jgi:short-subunit dehydrogenase involved in D-alanine esterification of teichoic acids